MIVKVLDVQIPAFWENIKFCAMKTSELQGEALSEYLNSLLCSLLSNRSQCFVRLDENRILIALLITKFKLNKISITKHLHIQCVYSFRGVSDSKWIDEFSLVRKFAEKEDCKSITFDTHNEKVMQLMQLMNFKEVHRSFELILAGG